MATAAAIPSVANNEQRAVLYDILTKAAGHDRACREAWRAVSYELGLHSGREMQAHNVLDVEELLNRYAAAITQLHAAIAPVALERAAVLALVPSVHAGGEILALRDAAAEQFLRPLFEAAGIGERFVAEEATLN